MMRLIYSFVSEGVQGWGIIKVDNNRVFKTEMLMIHLHFRSMYLIMVSMLHFCIRLITLTKLQQKIQCENQTDTDEQIAQTSSMTHLLRYKTFQSLILHKVKEGREGGGYCVALFAYREHHEKTCFLYDLHPTQCQLSVTLPPRAQHASTDRTLQG